MNKTLRGILEDLENVTAAYKTPSPGKESRSMYEKDLTASVDALTRLIKYNAANSTRPLSNKHDVNNLVKTTSNLLELSNLQAWKTALKVVIQLNIVPRHLVPTCQRFPVFGFCDNRIKKVQSKELVKCWF